METRARTVVVGRHRRLVRARPRSECSAWSYCILMLEGSLWDADIDGIGLGAAVTS